MYCAIILDKTVWIRIHYSVTTIQLVQGNAFLYKIIHIIEHRFRQNFIFFLKYLHNIINITKQKAVFKKDYKKF